MDNELAPEASPASLASIVRRTTAASKSRRKARFLKGTCTWGEPSLPEARRRSIGGNWAVAVNFPLSLLGRTHTAFALTHGQP